VVTSNPIPIIVWLIIGIAVSAGIIALAITFAYSVYKVGKLGSEWAGGFGGILIALAFVFVLFLIFGGGLKVSKKGITTKGRK